MARDIFPGALTGVRQRQGEGDETVLQAVASRWNAAAAPWNPSQLAAIYADDAFFFGGLREHYVGKKRIEEYYSNYNDVLSWASIYFNDQAVSASIPNVIVAQGFAELTFGLIEGKTTRNTLRTTLILVAKESGWEITLHHFSPLPEAPPIPR
ncbi:YybH family protein [Paraburkholderia strydomiana]|uniref:YybH family protein n=1 Tax=Paraburkholderia strydomiana TaxID=1245417 RepID=UPI0038BBBE1D